MAISNVARVFLRATRNSMCSVRDIIALSNTTRVFLPFEMGDFRLLGYRVRLLGYRVV